MNRRPHELPRVLVIDDIFGRTVRGRWNQERADLCKSLLLEDVTGDESGRPAAEIARPVAQATFCRAQKPPSAEIGDLVENDLEACLGVIRAGWSLRDPATPPWALVLLDLCFYTGPVTVASHERLAGVPEGRPDDDRPATYFGLVILEAIRLEFPKLPVLVLSGQPRSPVSHVVDARGALGFIGSSDPDVRLTFEDALWTHGLIPDNQETGIVGYSLNLLLSLRAARRGSSSRNLLIRGESGTGKELLAQYVHDWSRPGKPFVPVNAGTLPEQQYLSELFGHVRGAFTDAVRDKTGLIVEAGGGDLFLDEIATLPGPVQLGLLRVLENRVVRPMGAADARGVEVDVRFLFATNEDIEGLALLGQFRQDFLERLRFGGTITSPPLRERQDDLPLLVERFLREAVREQNEVRARTGRPRAVIRRITPEALDLLRSHDWPGNVRALESAVKKAASDHPNVESLHPHHFETLAWGQGRSAPDPARLRPAASSADLTPAPTLADALELLDGFDFGRLSRTDLSGALPRIKRSFGRFAARLLGAALAATSRPTTDDPEGQIRITSAVRHLVGAPRLKTSPAADEVKRLLAEVEFRDTPSLQSAWETAIQLRPTQPRRQTERRLEGDSIRR